MFGAYDLETKSGTFLSAPSEIIIHDRWNPFVQGYDDDIALLILDDNVPVTKYIRPICMWKSSAGILKVNEGFVAGWGKTESSNKNYRRLPS